MPSSSNLPSLRIDTTSMTAWDQHHDDDTNLSPIDQTESMAESETATLVDIADLPTPAAADAALAGATPRSPRKRRAAMVFGMLTNRYLRSRKNKTTTVSPTSPKQQKVKPKKAKPFKYSGEMLNHAPDHFMLQATTKVLMFAASNVRDAALLVEREWLARGVHADKMPRYECPDKHTLIVRESTAWLAEHEPDRLQEYLTLRKLGAVVPF